jgi:hypothetical protein
VETVPADEWPKPDPRPACAGPIARRSNGTVADSEAAKALGRLGGLQRQLLARIIRNLGMVELAADHEFAAYERAGQEFAEHEIKTLAEMYDGICGAGPASIVKTAAMQLSASRYLYDKGKQTGDAKLLGQASQLGNDARVNIGSALELQSREAEARATSGNGRPRPWLREVKDGDE